MLKRILGVFVVLLNLSFVPVYAAPDTELYISPSVKAVSLGESFTLEARVDPGVNEVTAVELHLSFDPSILRIDSANEGPSFPTVFQGATIDNANGTLSMIVGITPGGQRVTTDTLVANVSFSAIGESTGSTVAIDVTSESSAQGESGNVVVLRTPGLVTVDNVPANVYRFWSNAKQGHFYTISETEKNHIIATYPENVWKYEGVAWKANHTQESSTLPVYRFWSNSKQHHFYTISEAEKNYVIANYPENVWKYEGVAYYAYPTQEVNTQPVYRFWSDTKQGHFFTSSEAEKNHIIATYPENVWKYEGIGWYVPE